MCAVCAVCWLCVVFLVILLCCSVLLDLLAGSWLDILRASSGRPASDRGLHRGVRDDNTAVHGLGLSALHQKRY